MTYYDSNTWNIHLKCAYISREKKKFFFKRTYPGDRQKEERKE